MRRAATLAALLFTTGAAYADRSVVHNFNSVTAAPRVRSVLIDVPAGSVRVLNGRSGEIKVTGLARRDFDSWDSRSENQKIVDDITVETYVNGDEAVVRRRFGANAQGWRSQKFTAVELTVELPQGTGVEFDMSFGEVHIEGSFGDIDVDLRAGTVHIETPRADVRDLSASCRVGEVRTNLGHEIVTREGVLPGRTRFENPAGKTRINAHVTAGEVHVILKR